MDRFVTAFTAFCLLVVFGWGASGELPAQSPRWAVPYSVDLNGTPGPGYIFLSPRSTVLYDDHPSNLMLMDSAANLIWYAPIGPDTSAPYYNFTITDFKILSDGRLAYWTPLVPRFWYIMDNNFEIIDSLTCNGFSSTDEHDLVVDEDGNYLLICDTTVIRNANGMLTRDGIPGSANCSVVQQVVQEQTPNKQTIREWYSLDHIALDETDTVHWGNPGWMDHTHMNSLLLDGDGIITSSRNLGEITRYDRQTGDITWRLGGRGNMFTVIGDTTYFSAQHDANIAPNGNLYLFDNGTAGGRYVARYVEYALDTVNWTATLVRSHEHPTGKLSRFMGNAIHLDNGNVIVDWGGEAPQDSIREVTEFAPNGDIVMEIDFVNTFFSYRVHKEALPWALERPELSCDDGQQTLSAPMGYDYYEWSTGESTRTITVSAPGTYQVWVNHGIGYMSSEPVTIADPAEICLALATPEEVAGRLSIYPNPTRDRVNLEIPATIFRDWELEIVDALGRKVWSQSGRGPQSIEINTEAWIRGVYAVQLRGEKHRFVGKIVRW